MKEIAVVYWSGTGNTKAMAEAVCEGIKANGSNATLLTADAFDASKVAAYDAIAFGCPSMGAEVLEEEEFEPMFQGVESSLQSKNIALFGSYGWGDGEWMRNWVERCTGVGANLVCKSVICNDYPDEDGLNACVELGKQISA